MYENTDMHGHILDLVIFREKDNLIQGVSVSSILFDQFPNIIDICLQKQSVSAKVISYRIYKLTEKDDILADLRVTSLVDHLIHLYNSTLRDLVDEHAHLRTKEMPRKPLLPWSCCGSGQVCVFIMKYLRSVKLKLRLSLPLPNQDILVK